MMKFRKTLQIMLTILIITGMTSQTFALPSVEASSIDISDPLAASGKYLLETVTNPMISSVGGEWTIIGLARSSVNVPQSYFDGYKSNVEKTLKEKQGNLTNVKYTEYSRIILALTAIGIDPSDVAGYDLLERLSDFNALTKQGINGAIYALIALDSKNYEIHRIAALNTPTTRELLINYILNKEINDSTGIQGGFALTGNSPDPDMTGMALQALAPYRFRTDVKAAIERSLKVLDDLELDDGSFKTYGEQNSESIVQVILAKAALGIDPGKQVEALLGYHVKGGGFEHVAGQGVNAMATEQGFYALVAYDRYLNGMNPLFDMSDATNEIKVVVNEEYLDFDQPPVNDQGRVLVPMRLIFEALGAEVSWDQANLRVNGTLGNVSVTLTVGDTTADIDGKICELDVPPKIINGRTLVPVRFISESLNARVTWYQTVKTVVIDK